MTDVQQQDSNEHKISKEKHPLKILHAGFHRSGTASVCLALEMLDMGPVWHGMMVSLPLLFKGISWWTKNDCAIFRRLDKHDPEVNFNEWFELIQCKSVMDFPTILYWDQIFKQYPNCKVIVPCFEYKKWHESMVDLTNVLYSKPFTFSSYFMGLCSMVQKEYWPRLLNHNIDKFIKDEQFSKKYYHETLQHIKSIVPKEQLLIYDVRDGWEPLCKFVDKPIPDKPFPRANMRGAIKKKVQLSVVYNLCIVSVVVATIALIFYCFT